MTRPIIDLRSDTVTQPCEAMRLAMLRAEVGDDVYGEDPTTTALQDRMAEITGHESALFFPSGTQSNLVALLSHCQRGDEYIVGQTAHTYKYEGGGAAVLGGIQPQPLERTAAGIIDLTRIEGAIKADDIHFAKTRLLALENTTTTGVAVPLDYFRQARQLCDRNQYRHAPGWRQGIQRGYGSGRRCFRNHFPVRYGLDLPFQGFGRACRLGVDWLCQIN